MTLLERPRRRTTRWLARTVLALVVTTATTLGLAAPALAATGTVQASGGLYVRSGPGTGYSVVGSVANGATVNITCQTTGEWINGNWGATNIWDRLDNGGYVSDGFVYTGSNGQVAPSCTSSRADNAVAWYEARFGSTAYEGYCEMAAENAYGRTGIYASAMADWNDAVARGTAHRGDLNAPRGALVFWNISAPYGHVGISRGDGSFVATSVNGRIGSARLPYYANYLGWSWPNF
ncbi:MULTISPECIES: SH3 domain-containing protein [unclassified Micromonospora]|uniref:SH3 domain-containing protein n=1 Tax=unclassified Micromonospora TaxID=2617518 RepID=UPI0033CD56E9